MRASRGVVLAGLLLCVVSNAAHGGGNQQAVDVTGRIPSPVPGLVLAGAVPIRWDPRCLPVRFRVNDTLDPIPNPLGPPVLTVAQATSALQRALDAWNDIPTSFIDMRIVGTTSNPGEAGLDMANEITFRPTLLSAGLLAVSNSWHLIEDTTFVDGDDVDGDGLPDVSSAISTCTEVNGRTMIPAGFYRAGTIVDNDVVFSSDALRFTVGAPDTDIDSVDLRAVAVHEFGHSHGLAHSLTNQLSAADGGGATMLPFLETRDPGAERAQRSLSTEDVAWSSFSYPAGSAPAGAPPLGPGKVPFAQVFGQITGKVRHGPLDQPIVGANVFAVAPDASGVDTIVSSGFSGTVQFHVEPESGSVEFVDAVNGKYAVPVPQGQFKVGIEPLDGYPDFGAVFNLTTDVGPLFGGHDFEETLLKLGRSIRTVRVEPGGTTSRIDFVTSPSTRIDNFGSVDTVGFDDAPPGAYYAVRISAAQLMAAVEPGSPLALESADFLTFSTDDSLVPRFAEVMLTTGTVHADGSATVEVARPLRRAANFVGQDADFARFLFTRPLALSWWVQRGIQMGTIENLFLVLRVPTAAPFPGPSGLPPMIGLNSEPPILGLSYYSKDGGRTFKQRTDQNFMFRLVLSR